jgi:hypothetical protein
MPAPNEDMHMFNAPPVPSVPTQRVLDRIEEIEAELKATSDALAKSLDDGLERFQSEIAAQLQALDRPRYSDAMPDLSLRSLKKMLPAVVSTAVLTALITTVSALLIQG